MKKQYINPFIKSPLDKAMRDYEIWFHLLEDGEPIEDALTALYSMTSVLNAAKPQAKLTGAIRLMEEIKQRGTWRKSDLMPMLDTLRTVSHEYPRLPREVTNKAVNKVLGVTP